MLGTATGAAHHTTTGIHKDDLVFTINGQPLKRYGSQGQQKTYLIALKLAQFDLTRARTGLRPMLLLDDIFDKIDPQRMRHLLQLLGGGRFGQVLITDTDASRLHTALGWPGPGRALLPPRPRKASPVKKKERTVAG